MNLIRFFFILLVIIISWVLWITSNVHIRINQQNIVTNLYKYFTGDTKSVIQSALQSDLHYTEWLGVTISADRHWDINTTLSQIIESGSLKHTCNVDDIYSQISYTSIIQKIIHSDTFQFTCDRQYSVSKESVLHVLSQESKQFTPDSIPQYWVKWFTTDPIYWFIWIKSTTSNISFDWSDPKNQNNFLTIIQPEIQKQYTFKGSELKAPNIIVDVFSKSDKFLETYQPLLQQFDQSIIKLSESNKIVGQIVISRSTLLKYLQVNLQWSPIVTLTPEGFEYLQQRLLASFPNTTQVVSIRELVWKTLIITTKSKFNIHQILSELKKTLVDQDVFKDHTIIFDPNNFSSRVTFERKSMITAPRSEVNDNICKSLHLLNSYQGNWWNIIARIKWLWLTRDNGFEFLHQFSNLLLQKGLVISNSNKIIEWYKWWSSEYNPLNNIWVDWNNNTDVSIVSKKDFVVVCKTLNDSNQLTLYSNNMKDSEYFGPVIQQWVSYWSIINDWNTYKVRENN